MPPETLRVPSKPLLSPFTVSCAFPVLFISAFSSPEMFPPIVSAELRFNFNSASFLTRI